MWAGEVECLRHGGSPIIRRLTASHTITTYHLRELLHLLTGISMTFVKQLSFSENNFGMDNNALIIVAVARRETEVIIWHSLKNHSRHSLIVQH